ncbi:MAG: hypothetical protein CMB67_03970 [Euryarchaeota archaeon]|nr:hypothetical protein [Euryarchaeota archaeon]
MFKSSLVVLFTVNMSSRKVVIRPDRQGMYFVEGYINGHRVTFLVDTGANRCSMSDQLANRIGLKRGRSRMSNTAAGTAESYDTRLESVRIGEIEVTGVLGGIIPEMEISEVLLGMSFLKHIEFTQDDDKLILYEDLPESMPEEDKWWGKDKPEDEVDGPPQEDEAREEEIAQAEHEAKVARIEFEESEAKRKLAWSKKTTPMVYDVDRDGDGEITREEKIAHETGGGVMGLWWLTPEEAITIGVAAMLVIFTLGMGVVISSDETEWEVGEATVLLGTSWWEEEYEIEDCLYDDYNDEYYDCQYYLQYECGADVDYEFTFDGGWYSGEDGYTIGSWDDPCLEEVEFNVIPIGSTVTVWYDKEKPENNQLSEPGGAKFLIWFCCMPFFLLLLMVTLVNARFSNTPKDFDHGESRILGGTPGMFSQGGLESGGGVHHHHHHGRWGWGRRMFGRPRRIHRTRSRIRTGGRSSGGRRSTGGGRRSGGGGRRSSGGRRR